MELLLRALGATIGLFVVAGVASSVLRATALPRGLGSRLAIFVGRTLVRRSFRFVARRLRTYEAKDNVLSFAAPVAILVVLIIWLLLFWLGYSLLLWSLTPISFADALTQVVSSMLTLGFVRPQTPPAAAIDFAAALTGLLIIALQIAYLPVLYSAFNRREALVTLLESRAGSPPWGPEVLARHQEVAIMDSLPAFYEQWEEWAAELSESHSSYTTLLWFRSPHPNRSWITALVAVMDSAALYLSLAPDRAPSEARLCIRMGFTCLRTLADSLQLPYVEDPHPEDPISLTRGEFDFGVAHLGDVFPAERTPAEAWPHFKGWRVNYEAIAYEIADLVVAPPAPWSGERTQLTGSPTQPQRPIDRRPDKRTGVA